MSFSCTIRTILVLGLLATGGCHSSPGNSASASMDGSLKVEPQTLRSWDVFEGKAFSVFGSEVGPHVMVHIGVNPNAGLLTTDEKGREVSSYESFYPRVPALVADDQIQWVIKDEALVAGESDHFWKTFDVDYRPRDLALVQPGHVLVLGESANGETLIESWQLAKPYSPKYTGAPWSSFHGSEVETQLLDTRAVECGPDLMIPRWQVSHGEARRFDFGEAPVLLASTKKGTVLFLLTQNVVSGHATLRQLEPGHDWAETLLATSDEHPMLKTCDSLKALNVGREGGFELLASSLGLLLKGDRSNLGCLSFRGSASSRELGDVKVFPNFLAHRRDMAQTPGTGYFGSPLRKKPQSSVGVGGSHLVFPGEDFTLRLNIGPEEFEEAPVFEGGGAEPVSVEAEGPGGDSTTVDYELRWKVEGVLNSQFTKNVSYHLRDVEVVEPGHVLTLGVSNAGETIIESWLFDAPYGRFEPTTDWLPALVGEGVVVPLGLQKGFWADSVQVPALRARRTELYRSKLGELPELMCTSPDGHFVFVVTRDMGSQETTLRGFEPRKKWRASVIGTSDELRSLGALVGISARRTKGLMTGYVLFALASKGFVDASGAVVERVPASVCFEDWNGDGVMDAQRIFEEVNASDSAYPPNE